jgi:hypothetical protein
MVKSSKVSVVQWQGIEKLPESASRQVKVSGEKV